jgi:glutathione synthase/RimK-type ligase-like ATP-grasp enzyme
MILIITHKQDYTADFVINKLNQQNIQYYRYNCEDCLTEPLTLKFGDISSLSFLSNKKITSVWYRRFKLPEVFGKDQMERTYLLEELEMHLHNLIAIIPAEKWLSYPSNIRNAENKYLQMEIAVRIGFRLPKTLISNDKKQVKEFLMSNEQTIIKPVNKGRVNNNQYKSKLIFTSLIPENIPKQLDNFQILPGILQEYISKDYEIRITVVGNKLFSAKVDSQTDNETAIDWRKKKLKFERCEIPKDLEEKCFKMLKELNISFGAFDFIKSTDGEYYFLEVNPNGQWVWIENDTSLPISDAIINYLS